jgi:2-polyprenyl-6-methoxyphenol hydroxylase-like FAD-dependent oxidoreductase
MKAIIVGGGIMGLATAWALARAGHEVELLDRDRSPIRSPPRWTTIVSSATPTVTIGATRG